MLIKNLLVLKNAYLGLAVSWTVAIAFLCLVQFSTIPKVSISGVDKYVHFIFHFVFTALWNSYYWQQKKVLTLRSLGFVLMFSVLYGILIEVLQHNFTITRKADIYDVGANFLGAFSATTLLVIYKHYSIK